MTAMFAHAEIDGSYVSTQQIRQQQGDRTSDRLSSFVTKGSLPLFDEGGHALLTSSVAKVALKEPPLETHPSVNVVSHAR